jgi:hypothetical protein
MGAFLQVVKLKRRAALCFVAVNLVELDAFKFLSGINQMMCMECDITAIQYMPPFMPWGGGVRDSVGPSSRLGPRKGFREQIGHLEAIPEH